MSFLNYSSKKKCSSAIFSSAAACFFIDLALPVKYTHRCHLFTSDFFERKKKPIELKRSFSGNSSNNDHDNFIHLYHELIKTRKIEEDPFQKKLILILQALENNINDFYGHVEAHSENSAVNTKKSKKSFFAYLFPNKERGTKQKIDTTESTKEQVSLEHLRNDDNFFLYTSENSCKQKREIWRFSKIETEEDILNNSTNCYSESNSYKYLNKNQKDGITYVRGLYIYGSVGRGKTYFLNLFFDRIKISKLKIHYHNFMQEVHRCFHEEKINNSENPIKNVAIKLNKKYKLIFIDEFQVVHISDAMIIKSLFKYMFRYGTIFLFSSNRDPKLLYHNGLNRDQFIPFIKLLYHYNYIYEIDNFCDYRVKHGNTETNVYNIPNKTFEEIKNICASMYASTYKKDLSFVKTITQVNKEIAVSSSKKVVVPYKLGGYGIFSFNDLCSQNISVEEYSAIANEIHTLFIYDVKQMSEEMNGNEMRRFILLMDILYEKNIRVFFFSDFPIFQIFQAIEIISYFQTLLMKLKNKYEYFNHFIEAVQDELKEDCFDKAIFWKILFPLDVTKQICEKLYYAVQYNINKEYVPIEYLRQALCFHITNYEVETEKHLQFLQYKTGGIKVKATPYLLFDENVIDTAQENIFASTRTLSRMKHMSTLSYLENHKKLYASKT